MQSEFSIFFVSQRKICVTLGVQGAIRQKYLKNILTIFFPTRFLWLVDFLNYLKNWKESTDNRQGNFTQNARSRIFISWQTYERFQISVFSVIEATKFLLQEGMEFVLTERFCQDPEEYFGNQLKLGRRSENCDISSFGYNNNTIRIQRTVSCQSGNTRGRKDRSKAWEHIRHSCTMSEEI